MYYFIHSCKLKVGFEGPGLGFHEFPGILSFCVDKFSYRKSMDLRKDFFKFACIRRTQILSRIPVHVRRRWVQRPAVIKLFFVKCRRNYQVALMIRFSLLEVFFHIKAKLWSQMLILMPWMTILTRSLLNKMGYYFLDRR